MLNVGDMIGFDEKPYDGYIADIIIDIYKKYKTTQVEMLACDDDPYISDSWTIDEIMRSFNSKNSYTFYTDFFQE